ncbi:ATPase [Candidatus Entotheonella serta]|nr:ATPase [Candidatus Entotheonella serta]
MQQLRRRVGVVVNGSLVAGLEMKLDEWYSVEDIRAGKFVVIEGEKSRFFCMVIDVRLDATNPQVLADPPSEEDEVIRQVLHGSATYGTVCLRPLLMMDKDEVVAGHGDPHLVKTIPVHFSVVCEAEEEDVNQVFGSEEMGTQFFHIGRPLDMETPICMDLESFVERSNGIFGKTGTGKTFLTRLVLSGLIHSNRAVNLIYDMHSEYGWQATQESGNGRGGFVKGLKQLFGSRVAIFTLDPESARRRGIQSDFNVKIPYNQITVEDIASLADELNLNPTAVESAYLIVNRFGREWLSELLRQDPKDIKDFAEHVGAHPESISALHRKLKRLEKFDFLQERVHEDTVYKILEFVDKGVHIVLEFGQQSSFLCYMLVSNILTRRLHDQYVMKTERFLSSGKPQDKPKQLIITIEEAHKFLNPTAARQTIFGTIAREMRKYFVSLLIVDQRPSSIDDEVLSQVGTRITALLSDEKDINAVLTGVSNANWLRSVLASLDSKQQALLMGHAVPMPVVIRTRDYDHVFYSAMGAVEGEALAQKAQSNIADLFGDR